MSGLGLAEAALVFEELGRALVPGPLVASHLAAGLVDGADDGSVVVGLVERPGPAGRGRPARCRWSSSTWPTSTSCSCCPTRASSASTRRSLDATPLPRPMDPLTPVWSLPVCPPASRSPGRTSPPGGGGTAPCSPPRSRSAWPQWACDLAVEYAKQPASSSAGRSAASRPSSTSAPTWRCGPRWPAAPSRPRPSPSTSPTSATPTVAAAGAKLLADEAAVTNGRSCIQVHGGMGFTWEVPAHLAYKRARVLATQFGDGRRAGRGPGRVPGRRPADRRTGRTVRPEQVRITR